MWYNKEKGNNMYRVVLKKCLGDRVRLHAWGKVKRKLNYGTENIPYKLAMFLQLMPNGNSFTNSLYGFDHIDFDNFSDSENVKVTSKKGLNLYLVVNRVD